jgi:phosphoesterase RecJ-like protein
LPEDISGRPAGDVLAELAGVLRSASKVLIATHVSPDGDAIGSATALALGLRRLGKEARVFSASDVEQRFEGIILPGMVEVVDDGSAAELQGQFDLCVLLDTSETSRAGVLEPVIFAEGQKRICIDHHLLDGEYSFDSHLVLAESPATACLVLCLLDELEVALDQDIARALWLALATDTGWFRFANAGRIAFQCAARLLETGLDTEDLYGLIYGSRSSQKTRLWGKVLDDHKVELGGRLVWSSVSIATMEDLGTAREDLDGVIDILKGVRGAHAAALISEFSDDTFKVSLRSVEQVDVEEIARGFGGGGHAKAAGYTAGGTVEEIVEGLRQVLSGA